MLHCPARHVAWLPIAVYSHEDLAWVHRLGHVPRFVRHWRASYRHAGRAYLCDRRLNWHDLLHPLFDILDPGELRTSHHRCAQFLVHLEVNVDEGRHVRVVEHADAARAQQPHQLSDLFLRGKKVHIQMATPQ